MSHRSEEAQAALEDLEAAGEDLDPLPTSAAVTFRLYMDRWEDLAPERAVLEEWLTPKEIGR